MLSIKNRSAIFLFICLFLAYGAHIVHEYEPYTYAHADPGWMVSTVMSIVEDHDLDLRNQLMNDPNQAADQTSLGQNDEWYPLHEILMPILTVPFYVVFGINGCLIFNMLVCILFMISLFHLCARHVDYPIAFLATVLTAFSSTVIHYTYSYSLDVFSAFLFILAYWCAVQKRFFRTGLVWGLAVYSRFPLIVTLVGLICFLFLEALASRDPEVETVPHARYAHRIRPFLATVAGALPVLFSFLITNWLMFGSPFTTSYDRWRHTLNGQTVTSSQMGAFTCALIERLPITLLDPKTGLLIGAPLLLIAVAFGTRPFWKRARNEMILASLTAAALVILFTKYCNSFPGSVGNRYLIPVIALSSVPLAMALQNCFNGRAIRPDLSAKE